MITITRAGIARVIQTIVTNRNTKHLDTAAQHLNLYHTESTQTTRRDVPTPAGYWIRGGRWIWWWLLLCLFLKFSTDLQEWKRREFVREEA